jgi:hypothetical protein
VPYFLPTIADGLLICGPKILEYRADLIALVRYLYTDNPAMIDSVPALLQFV